MLGCSEPDAVRIQHRYMIKIMYILYYAAHIPNSGRLGPVLENTKKNRNSVTWVLRRIEFYVEPMFSIFDLGQKIFYWNSLLKFHYLNPSISVGPGPIYCILYYYVPECPWWVSTFFVDKYLTTISELYISRKTAFSAFHRVFDHPTWTKIAHKVSHGLSLRIAQWYLIFKYI